MLRVQGTLLLSSKLGSRVKGFGFRVNVLGLLVAGGDNYALFMIYRCRV